MARYVCKCGGTNPFCTTCEGERYYTPKKSRKQKTSPEIPEPRTELSEEKIQEALRAGEETERIE